MRLFIFTVLSFFVVSCLYSEQYVGMNLGTNTMILTNEKHNPKSGWLASCFFGYKSSENIRMEIFFSYLRNEFKTKYNLEGKDTIKSKEYRTFNRMAYMANVIYDLSKLSVQEITPYVGFGLGYCKTTEKNKIKYDQEVEKDQFRDGRIAYQGMVGIRHSIDEIYSASLEYKYFIGSSHIKDHSVGINFAKNF